MDTPKDSYFGGPEHRLDWPNPVRSGLDDDQVNGHNRPADAVESVRWLGWWIDPVDLVAWHPDDWSYGIYLRELGDPRRALFMIMHVVTNRYHHPGPLAGDQSARSARWRLAVGFIVMLDQVLGVRDNMANNPPRMPTVDDVRRRLNEVATRVADGRDRHD